MANLKQNNDMAVSPIVATLVLIVVAVIGAVAVGTIMGTFSTDVSNQANAGDAAGASSTEILIAGSTTVQPASEELAKVYMAAHPGIKITVQAGGSGAGVSSVGSGIVDIGSASRAMSDAEMTSYPDVETYQIGGSGVVFIVNDANTVAAVAKADLANAFGANDVFGGALATATTPITDAYQRSEASGTEDTVSKYLLGPDSAMNKNLNATGQVGNSGVLAAVKGNAASIGFVDLGYAVDASGNEVSGIDIVPVIDGAVTGTVAPSKTSVLAALKDEKAKATQQNNYPQGLVRPLNYMIKGTPSSVVKNYITFCQSPGSIDSFNKAGMFGLAEFS
ncbi:MAG: substrate-binding domain-containing protein [Methanoregula sp.]|jgi:phosphate transport system substrate-binding protein|nr:substrate-binding domain-containing protein [Methanoregula sp.]